MIGIFISQLGGGGAERVVFNLVNYFERKKIPHILILRFKAGNYLASLNPKTPIAELRTNNPIIIVYRLVRICKKHRISLLFSAIRYCNVLALIANFFIKTKVIIREANTMNDIVDKRILPQPISFIKSKAIFYLMKVLYRNAVLLIGNSIDTINDVNKNIGISHNKLVVISNPLINDSIFQLKDEPLDDERFEKLSKPIIISVGRLVYQKNFKHLIESFSMVYRHMTTASLVILGEGPEKDKLVQLARSLGIEHKVHLLGFVNNPYKYMKHSNIFVLSSLYEGFGNVIVEALALGLPIIATNCRGGPKEILDYGKFGVLVPLNDKEAMAQKIVELLKSKPSPDLLINRANQYHIDKVAERYINVLLNNRSVA